MLREVTLYRGVFTYISKAREFLGNFGEYEKPGTRVPAKTASAPNNTAT
jgi:hypothetical protein